MARKYEQKRIMKMLLLSGLTVVSLSGCAVVEDLWGELTGNAASSETTDSQTTSASFETETSEEPVESSEESAESIQSSLADQLIDVPEAHTSDWNLILVNRDHQLTANLEFEPYYTENGFILDQRIAERFEAMLADGRAQGMEFVLVSTYRTLADQQANYDSVYQSYLNQGISHEEAVKKTEDYIALPNASEHSTGLAFDITEPDLYYQKDMGLVDDFDQTPEAQWLYEHAPEYGFILRYPKGKEAITYIQYEAWHFRYVGVENAQYMKENQLTLEEYIEILQHNESIRQQMEANGE